MSHTKGPWRWTGRGRLVAFVPGDVDETIVETDDGYYPPFGADRDLIAAAPDLLEALQELVIANEQWNASVEDIVGRPPNWADGYLDKARAAISKALGETK